MTEAKTTKSADWPVPFLGTTPKYAKELIENAVWPRRS